MTTVRRWLPVIGVIAGLGGYELVRALLLSGLADTIANFGVGLALLAFAPRLGLHLSDLGLNARTARRGLRDGLVVWSMIGVTLFTVALIPATRSVFDDQRSNVTFGAMLLTVLVIIPLGTAFLEEVAFRGVLYAMCRQRTSSGWAAWISSIVFGLWHVAPTLSTTSSNNALHATTRSAGTVALLAGMVIAMTIAGLVLCWLRMQSGSLLAPFVVHAGVNGTAFLLAWIVVHR